MTNFTTKLFWEFRRRRNIEKCHRLSHSFVSLCAVIFVQILIAGSKCSPAIYSSGKFTHFTFTRTPDFTFSTQFDRARSYLFNTDWRINIMSKVWPKNFWAHQIERNIYLSSVSRYKKSRELFHQSVRGPQVLLWVWGRREESGKKLMETANMFQLLRSIRRKKSSNLFAASFPNYLQTSFNIHHNTTFILYGTTVVNMKVEKWRSEC